jgi:hypothetical protein
VPRKPQGSRIPPTLKLAALVGPLCLYARKCKGRSGGPSFVGSAVRGVYRVYSAQDFWSVGAKREVQQGRNLADVAKKVGVEQFVYRRATGFLPNRNVFRMIALTSLQRGPRKGVQIGDNPSKGGLAGHVPIVAQFP